MIRPKMSGQCCGNCKWMKVNENNLTHHNPPRWRSKNGVGECSWPLPLTVLPLSITTAHALMGARRRWMAVTETGCPTWEACEEDAAEVAGGAATARRGD